MEKNIYPILQFIVPQWKENEDIAKYWFNSLNNQLGINWNEISVIVVNDGSNTILSKEFLNSFNFKVDYLKNKVNGGPSVARNIGLSASTADFVMFCDIDDCFYAVDSVAYIMQYCRKETSHDIIRFNFNAESTLSDGKHIYRPYNGDGTFVHGKLFKRSFLLEHKIAFNPNLRFHEDSYFNALSQSETTDIVDIANCVYIWKENEHSVSRQDDFLLKTLPNFIDSVKALILEFIARNNLKFAIMSSRQVSYYLYFMLQQPNWLNPKNSNYREEVERKFYNEYFKIFINFYNQADQQLSLTIWNQEKQRGIESGVMQETLTYVEWINHLKSTYEKEEN